MSTRIYEVSGGEDFYLVEANTQAQALRHIADGIFTVKVADQKTLVGAIQGGHQIIDATAKKAKAEEPEEE